VNGGRKRFAGSPVVETPGFDRRVVVRWCGFDTRTSRSGAGSSGRGVPATISDEHVDSAGGSVAAFPH